MTSTKWWIVVAVALTLAVGSIPVRMIVENMR